MAVILIINLSFISKDKVMIPGFQMYYFLKSQMAKSHIQAFTICAMDTFLPLGIIFYSSDEKVFLNF